MLRNAAGANWMRMTVSVLLAQLQDPRRRQGSHNVTIGGSALAKRHHHHLLRLQLVPSTLTTELALAQQAGNVTRVRGLVTAELVDRVTHVNMIAILSQFPIRRMMVCQWTRTVVMRQLINYVRLSMEERAST